MFKLKLYNNKYNKNIKYIKQVYSKKNNKIIDYTMSAYSFIPIR